MKTLDASNVDTADLERLEDTVKTMPRDSELAFFLAALAAAVRGGDDVMAAKDTDLISPARAAKLLGISRVHLYKVMDAGDIAFVTVGRDRRIAMGDLVTVLNERDAASKATAERFAKSAAARSAALENLKSF